MKKFVLAAILLTTPAFAQEKPAAPPPKPVCGKTVAECQTAFDAQAKQIATLSSMVGTVASQRDQIQQQLNNVLVQQAVQQAAPK